MKMLIDIAIGDWLLLIIASYLWLLTFEDYLCTIMIYYDLLWLITIMIYGYWLLLLFILIDYYEMLVIIDCFLMIYCYW